MYNSAKLNADHIGRLPDLLPAISNSERLDTEKALLFLHNHYPEKVTAGVPIRAILVPHITGRPETRLSKASAGASLRALAPSTIFLMPGPDHEAFRNVARFVRQVPSYTLELGTDLTRIPEVISQLLAGE